MSGEFRRATDVQRTATSDAGATFAAEVHPGWDIGGNANGGYLLAIVARAMAETVDRPPLTITSHYLRPAPPGPCTVRVEVVRVGRRLATVSATLEQSDRAIIRALGSFGEQERGGPGIDPIPPVDLPPVDECLSRPNTFEAPGLTRRLAQRLHPDDVGYVSGDPSGDALVRGWFDLADDEPLDLFAVLLASDAFPPSIFNSGLPVAWVPTVELTVHLRGAPGPGPLRCRFTTTHAGDGLLDEDGAIWDRAGALVALSRQVALMPRA